MCGLNWNRTSCTLKRIIVVIVSGLFFLFFFGEKRYRQSFLTICYLNWVTVVILFVSRFVSFLGDGRYKQSFFDYISPKVDDFLVLSEEPFGV